MSGKAPKDPNDQTATSGSVDYDIITGKMKHHGSSENVDSLGNTMLGTEVKERFSSMRQAFLKMDSNRDGHVTANEIRALCRQWNIPQSEADRVLDAADMDANGTIDFNEFAKRFDPDYDRPVDGDPLPMASSTAYGAIYDDRPIASSGWGNFDDMEYADSHAAAATKIQSAARGRQARSNVKTMKGKRSAPGGGGGGGPISPTRSGGLGRSGPAALDGDGGQMCSSPTGGGMETPAGSGSRAARQIRTDQLEQENAELKARVQELEEENAMLKKALAASQEREGGSPTMERTRSPGEGAGHGGGRGGREADEEEPLADVVVYGRQDDKKTQAVMAELKKNGVNFDAFDFDSTKDYMSALKANGVPANGKVLPPVVVVRGKHAFWDEPDGAIAVHFPTMLINELRKLGLVAGIDDGPTVTRNVSMDVEIAERFHNMQQAFLKMDDNRDGRVSKKELMSMCKNWNIPQSEADRIIREADFDSSGNLDFREFARRFGR